MKNLQNVHIFVIGDFMLDHWIYGNVTRISQEAPVQVVDVTHTESKLGGAGNVVKNISDLGVKVSCCALCGDDNNCTIMRKLLESICNELYVITDNSRKTTVKTRIVSDEHHTQLLRYDVETKNTVDLKYDINIPNDVDIIIVSDYAKGFISEKVMNRLRSENKTIIVDPKPQNINLYKDVDFITPNHHEWREIMNNPDVCDVITSIPNKIITLGKNGIFVDSKLEGEKTHKGKERKVFNVTGAGDTVIATFSVCLALGYNIVESAYYANECGGIVVEKPGTASVTKEEFISVLDNGK